MLGIIVGTMVVSLNQFFVVTTPFELICFVPAMFVLFGIIKYILGFNLEVF
jgi:hypothetical protein